MPMTVSDLSGDGVIAPLIATSIELPDSGTSINIGGSVQSVQGTLDAITPATLTIPVAPGSGLIYWNVQVNTTTGVAQVVQSTTSDPAVISGNIVVFRQTLAPAQTDPAMVSTDTTPDSW